MGEGPGRISTSAGRAEAIKEMLAAIFKVAPDRLFAVGLEITVADAVAAIPSHHPKDNHALKMTPFEIVH